ncbi:MAG: cytochrome C [Flavobacteriaceae bacterium]|nr:cytochrome C [Flavobacteriaceae bacterium]
MEPRNKINVYLDDETDPFITLNTPVKFILDTTKIPDGKHKLRIVAKSSGGVEGIKIIPFEVKNGPTISVVGLNENDVVSEEISVIVNSYGSEGKDQFVVYGSETPKGIPSWIWALVILFVAFFAFYLIMNWNQESYKSFF